MTVSQREANGRLPRQWKDLWARAQSALAILSDTRSERKTTRHPAVALALRTVPKNSSVLVVSKGDESLLQLDSVHAQHFPQNDDGTYTGYHPATGSEAIGHLERLRGRGATHLLFPSFSLWWLAYYADLREHLERRYRLAAFEEDAGLLYALSEADDELLRISARPTPLAVEKWEVRAEDRSSDPGDAEPQLELTRNNAVERIYDIDPDRLHLLSGAIIGTDTASPRTALVSVAFLDEHGMEVAGAYKNFSRSERADIGWYAYLPTSSGSDASAFHCLLEPPERASRLRTRFLKWDRTVRDRLYLVDEPTVEPTTSVQLAQRLREAPHDIGLLRVLARLQQAEGELTACVSTLRELARATGAEDARRAYVRMSGRRRELDPAWRPVVPGHSPVPPTPDGTRICHLFKVAYPFESSGGAIRNLNVVKFQKHVGLDPYAVTPLGYPASHGIHDFAEEDFIAGVPHIRLRLPGRDDPELPAHRRLQLDAIATAGVIRNRGADIIHAASGFRGYELALKGIALARHFGLPLVYEVRSLHEHLWGSQHIPNKLDREWTQLRIAQENRCMDEATVVVTLADAMKQILCERGVPESKIVVIPNGVDETAFVPVALDPAFKESLGLAGCLVVGYISNISHREGHDVLLRAVAGLTLRRPELRCLIVGDGPERRSMEQLAAQLGIRDKVVFTGEVDHNDITRFYELIDVFVVPRRSDYAADHVTPLKPFEALALERAVVTADLPSLREIVGHEERGLLFKAEDHRDLAARIELLMDRPDVRTSLGRCGREWVLRERTWLRNAQRYSELYAELRERSGVTL